MNIAWKSIALHMLNLAAETVTVMLELSLKTNSCVAAKMSLSSPVANNWHACKMHHANWGPLSLDGCRASS